MATILCTVCGEEIVITESLAELMNDVPIVTCGVKCALAVIEARNRLSGDTDEPDEAP
jgi:hypothetical protein